MKPRSWLVPLLLVCLATSLIFWLWPKSLAHETTISTSPLMRGPSTVQQAAKPITSPTAEMMPMPQSVGITRSRDNELDTKIAEAVEKSKSAQASLSTPTVKSVLRKTSTEVPSDSTGTTNYLAGRVLVKFKANTTHSAKAALAARHSLTFIREIQLFNIAIYHCAPSKDIVSLCAKLMRESEIADAAPDHIRTAANVNDPAFVNQWYLKNTGQTVNGQSGLAGVDIRWLDARNRY